MGNFIKLIDTVDFKPIKISEQSLKQNDNFGNLNNPAIPLYVKIAATHSGLITRNNGMYLPDKMRAGANSFTAQYNKPILTHHDDFKDNIGRVVKAEYIDISDNVKAQLLATILNKNSRYTEKFIKDFTSGKLPFIQSVNFIADALNSASSILDDPDYQGLGYIQLTAAITDPDAKQKVLDGRYLTGSTGATTNKAICSVCKADWVADMDRCEHRPGKVYDGAKAFLIAGDLSYDEYSLVNVPADRHSRIMQINVNGITDSFEMDSSVGRTMSVSYSITDSVSKEDTTQEDTMDEELQKEQALLTDSIFPLGKEKWLDELKKIRPSVSDEALTKFVGETYKDASDFYTKLIEIELADYSEQEDEVLVKHLTENPTDVKLTPAQRKRLPASSFCGPNRSFPLADVTHVDTIRTLIDKATLSLAAKKQILANVDRKAQVLKPVAAPPESKKDNTEAPASTETVVAKKYLLVLSQDGKIVLAINEDKTIAIADIEGLKAFGDSIVEKGKALEDANKKIEELTTELNTLKADKAKVDSELTATQDELKITHDDLVNVNDQLITQEESLVKEKAQRVLDYKKLSGVVIADETVELENAIKLGKDGLDKEFVELTSKVDMKKIVDNINSGLARNPTGTVEDPTSQINDENKPNPTKQFVGALAVEYERIKMNSGPAAANRYLAHLKRQGFIK